MLLVLICIAIPLLVVGLIVFVRSLYGDEIFGLGWPPHELNRDDDYRLIKMRLNAGAADHPTSPANSDSPPAR